MSQPKKRKNNTRAASKSRRRVSPKTQTRDTGWATRWRGLVLKLGAVALVLLVGWLCYLDAMITRHFEGKRWAVPAKVYARPLELYEGLNISAAQLAFELNLLNYQPVAEGQPVPGYYLNNQGRYQLHTRGFDSWEGKELAQPVSFELVDNRIQNLAAQTGNDGIVRLEPAQIGGIYPAHNEDRILVTLNQVPKALLQALLVVEDREFVNHFGVSIKGIARALLTNIQSGSIKQGGSTLTQQLVKNFYLSSERSLSRKLVEALMAILLDFHYEKSDILEAYVNEVYLGQAGRRSIHGVGLASLFYFGQPLRELQIDQMALLVGIIKGPSWYDPRRQPERSLARRNQVLAIMREQGLLSEARYDEVVQRPLGVIAKPLYEDARYPAFLDLVRRQLRQDYRDEDLRTEGLRIFTTLNPWVQETFETQAQSHLKQLAKAEGKIADQSQVAGLITASNTGEVVALLGGRSSRYEGFNRALDAYRPIGSLAKPAVYLAAIEQGYHLASLLLDEPLSHPLPNGDVWSPDNFDKISHGEVPFMTAMAKSYNQAAARLALDVGIDSVVDVFLRLGVNKVLPNVPALSLGAASLSPFEVAQMYQTIAAEGFATPLRSIRSVLTADGQPLQRYALQVEQRFASADMYLLTTALQETVKSGTAKSADVWLPQSLQLAGKTGTSDEQRDSWFAGFSGNYLGVVWLGIDDNQTTPFTGATAALPIWAKTLAALPQLALQISPPAGVDWAWVDPQQNTATSTRCKNSLYVPVRNDSMVQRRSTCAGGAGNWFQRWLN